MRQLTLEILLATFDAKRAAVVTLTLVLTAGVEGNPTTPFTRDAMDSMKGPLRKRPPRFSAAHIREIGP